MSEQWKWFKSSSVVFWDCSGKVFVCVAGHVQQDTKFLILKNAHSYYIWAPWLIYYQADLDNQRISTFLYALDDLKQHSTNKNWGGQKWLSQPTWFLHNISKRPQLFSDHRCQCQVTPGHSSRWLEWGHYVVVRMIWNLQATAGLEVRAITHPVSVFVFSLFFPPSMTGDVVSHQAHVFSLTGVKRVPSSEWKKQHKQQ